MTMIKLKDYFGDIRLVRLRVIINFYSHSVVPGGLEVRSYMILEIHSICWTCSIISLRASFGISFPGIAGCQVMKSLVIKGLMTIE